MSEKYQKTSFREKIKNMKVNRAAVVTVVVLLAALTVIIAVSVAANRAKKNEDLPPEPAQTTATTTQKQDPPQTVPDKDPEQKPPVNNNNSSAVEDKLPSFILPASGIVSRKHDSTIQVYSTTMKDYRVHLGVDIVTEDGAPVYAAADGKVSKIWDDTLMGYSIAIKHSGDCYTIYKNLAETLPEGIAEGVSVKAGQLIGTVGESAMIEVADEPHLHFEMTVADLSVNPLEYFDEKVLESLKIDASHGE